MSFKSIFLLHQERKNTKHFKLIQSRVSSICYDLLPKNNSATKNVFSKTKTSAFDMPLSEILLFQVPLEKTTPIYKNIHSNEVPSATAIYS